MDTNDQIFWTFFITSMVGFVLALTKMCYKSKCKEVDLCCVKIIRDTEIEEKETEFIATHPSPNSLTTNESKDNIMI